MMHVYIPKMSVILTSFNDFIFENSMTSHKDVLMMSSNSEGSSDSCVEDSAVHGDFDLETTAITSSRLTPTS